MSEGDLEYRLYRCETGTAIGSKDWAIAITPERHLAIRHCATGQTARLLDIPPSSFKAASAEAEMVLREHQQVSQGYTLVGRAIVRKGHLERLASLPPARGTPSLHWEIYAPIPRESLLAELQSAVTQLQAGPLPDAVTLDAALGRCVVHSQMAWEFGYSDHGGMGADGRGGGVIQAEQGLLPVLLMITLQRRYPDRIALADANGTPLTPEFSTEDPLLGADRFEHYLLVQLIGRLGWFVAWTELPEAAEAPSALWV